MSKNLEFELDEFNEDDKERLNDYIANKSNKTYTESEMVIAVNDEEEWIGKLYPGDTE